MIHSIIHNSQFINIKLWQHLTGLYFYYFSHRQNRKWNGNGSLGNARLEDSGFGWVFIPFYAYSRVFTMSKFLLKYYN
jgi:hypothetical protein